MKKCAECQEAKPLTAFYRHPKSADGRMHICKDCHKVRMKTRRRTDQKVQEYDRMRSKRPERKAHIQRTSDQWRRDHQEAYRAQTAVGNAMRDGKISKRPCAECGATKHIHAHHADYSKPLEVTWLCALHHHRLHADDPTAAGHHAQA